MAVTGDGSVTFKKPEVVRISDNTLLANSYNVSTLLSWVACESFGSCPVSRPTSRDDQTQGNPPFEKWHRVLCYMVHSPRTIF